MNATRASGASISRRLLLTGLPAMALAGCKYGKSDDKGNSAAAGAGTGGDLAALRRGAMAGLVVPATRRDVRELVLVDGDGRERRLGEFSGRVLLVNFWATWCFPCRREMPSIGALQKAFAEKDFLVIAASEDRKGYKWAKEALGDLQADHLLLLMDEGARALRRLGERGLPTTILVDRHGREAARFIGPAEWNSEAAKAVVRALIAEK